MLPARQVVAAVLPEQGVLLADRSDDKSRNGTRAVARCTQHRAGVSIRAAAVRSLCYNSFRGARLLRALRVSWHAGECSGLRGLQQSSDLKAAVGYGVSASSASPCMLKLAPADSAA